MSVYNNNIPGPTDKLSASQADLLVNFQQLNTQFGVDHTAFNNAGANGDGFHKKITNPVQGSDPGSASGRVVTYSKTSSGSSELFLQRDAVATPIQLTRGTVNITGNITPPAKGHTFLPGGIVLQWGTVSAVPAGTAFTFDVAFTTIFGISTTISAAGAQASALSGISNAGATAHSESGTQTISYLAVGV